MRIGEIGLVAMKGTAAKLAALLPQSTVLYPAKSSTGADDLRAEITAFLPKIRDDAMHATLQAIAQGILAGPAAMYLFAVSIQRLGVARAAVFPATVPVLTLLLGWLLIGEPPTTLQAAGLAAVLAGFYLAQRQR